MLVQQNAEIKEQLRVVSAMLQEILRRQRSSDNAQPGRLPDNVQLPLKDYAAIEALEQQLESQELHNQLVGRACRVAYYHFLLQLYRSSSISYKFLYLCAVPVLPLIQRYPTIFPIFFAKLFNLSAKL